MPAILTHYDFAQKAISPSSEKYRKACYVGAQGPDIFFFYGQVPWKKRNRPECIDGFGRRLHHIDIAPVYAKMISIARQKPQKELLESYIDGLFLHYCLDRRCHPYIFSRTGVSEDEKLMKLYGGSHCLFETMVDFIIAGRKGRIGKPGDALSLDENDSIAITSLWFELNAALSISNYLPLAAFYESKKDYVSIENFLNFPLGLKRGLLKKVAGPWSLPYCMSFPRSLKKFEGIDFLNEGKATWVDPVSGLERNESFAELEDLALQDFKTVKEIITRGFLGEDIEGELLKFTQGINHDGTKEGEKKTHFSLVWSVEEA